MAGIALSGLASGFDTGALVDQLIAIDRQAITRIGLRQTAVQARGDNLGTVSGKLKTLTDAAAALQAETLWADTQSVTVSDPSRLGVTRTGGTGPGGYAVDVQRMASAARRTYDYVPQAGAQTITVGGVGFAIPAGATATQVAAQLNQTQGSPVYAAVVTDPVAGERLVLSARTTGQASVFGLTGTGFTEDAGQARVTNLDARVAFDGGAPVDYPTNTIEGAIPGLTLTLKSVTAGSVGVTVGPPGTDAGAVTAKAKAFVTAYNDVITTVRGFTDERPVAGATTSADARKGQLFGDTGLLGTLTRMRQSLGGGLAALGISTGATTGGAPTADGKLGKLVLDETKLSAALSSDAAGLRGALTTFATDLTAVVRPQIGTGTGTTTGGLIAGRVEASSRELKALTAQTTETNRRLDDKEKRLRAQFAAMETALQSAQTQQSWLSGQLAALSGTSA